MRLQGRYTPGRRGAGAPGKDQAWFFDTELLLKGERQGYRIFELPVEWIEDLDTRVKIVKTALEDIKGLLRVRFGG